MAHGQLVPQHYTEAINKANVRAITASTTIIEETTDRKRCSVM